VALTDPLAVDGKTLWGGALAPPGQAGPVPARQVRPDGADDGMVVERALQLAQFRRKVAAQLGTSANRSMGS